MSSETFKEPPVRVSAGARSHRLSPLAAKRELRSFVSCDPSKLPSNLVSSTRTGTSSQLES
eukprot:5255965-Amphidinium_carterae.1